MMRIAMQGFHMMIQGHCVVNRVRMWWRRVWLQEWADRVGHSVISNWRRVIGLRCGRWGVICGVSWMSLGTFGSRETSGTGVARDALETRLSRGSHES